MNCYTPNFNDPRVQSRTRRAIGFAAGVISSTKPHAWSTRYIDQWFGCASNPLSKYLRESLLIVTDHRYHWGSDTGQCKQYCLNSAGVDRLCEAIGLTESNNTHTSYPIVLEVADSQYNSELASGNFTYNDKSSRLWHPLQNFRRAVKRDVLNQNGYQYHYDIECCAMTLIHQHSQRVPEISLNKKQQQGPMDRYLFALRDYLSDRQTRRDQIAVDSGLDSDTVKRIINALLAGARLAAHPDTEIYQLLNLNLTQLRLLQNHKYLTELRADIKTCWDYIKPTMTRRSSTQKNGSERMLGIRSQQKWAVYFDLERQVLNQIRKFLSESNNKHFLEHDGWSCENQIDLTCLSQQVFENTGFRVKFEQK